MPGLDPGIRVFRAFSGEVDTGSPQKMRPSKEIERFHDSTQHESAPEPNQIKHVDGRNQSGHDQTGESSSAAIGIRRFTGMARFPYERDGPAAGAKPRIRPSVHASFFSYFP
jgi:hypothetical protein